MNFNLTSRMEEATIKSIDDCISVLQGDLHQPGTPAIVLKLTASWEKFKSFVTERLLRQQEDSGLQKANHEQLPAENTSFESKEDVDGTSRQVETGNGEANSLSSFDSHRVDVHSNSIVTTSENGQHLVPETSTIESSVSLEAGKGPTSTDTSPAEKEPEGPGMGEDYQKVEFATLYWHKSTGYYYDPLTQQFFTPTSYSQQVNSGEGKVAEAQPAHSTSQTGWSGQEVAQTSQTSWSGHDYYASQPALSQQANQYNQQQQQQQSAQVSQGSIADVLAAASDRVVERCGYQYNEGLDMYYDANSGLYYHQESKLYYDADLGCYYQYDYDNKKYTLHSRVRLPNQEEETKHKDRDRQVSSEEEFVDSPEDGEIRLPHIPRHSPPPEEEWAPCIRALVSESETLSKGTLFIITQDGASIGREPTGSNCLIKIPELKVSKLHAVISYDKHEQSFMVQDLGSVNGTFLNKDQRLGKSRESSQPCPVVHGHTLSIGSTTLSLHIHTGWETCAWCDPSRGAWQDLRSGDTGEEENPEELDLQRRKELNRIKKKYGLRVKDTYGNPDVVLKDKYSDRSEIRRQTVGSDVPASQRPDDAPSSVNEPISDDNRGRQMLEKMGWRKGEGLGKSGEGIAEPVRSEIRDGKLGLGMQDSVRGFDSSDNINSAIAMSKMRKRFDNIKDHNLAKKRKN